MLTRLLPLLILFFLSVTASAEENPYWIFFTDRGSIAVGDSVAAKRQAAAEPKLNSRRARALGADRIFDERDLPVNPAFIEQVTAAGAKIRNVTRYLNGVSAALDETALANVKSLPFVREVRPVLTLRAESDVIPSGEPSGAGKTSALKYGDSFLQADMVGVPGIQEMGYMGDGILITVLDSGFDGLSHAAFDSLQVVYTRDFVDGDSNPGGDTHGTQVLSVMAADDPGYMIGTAPHASYALARTEIRATETRVEEDNWVAAIEWADSIGTDVVNSSLGYFKFDDGFTYTYQDLDGMTAVTTVAADIATSKGIVVVNSTGNEGVSAWHYITTPADAFEVISVGAVDRDGVIAPTSSRGPTADGRIKPECVALGVNVLVVDPATASSYKSQAGTSFSSPAVAGAAALLLEVNPGWGPAEVRQALFTHASRAADPDTVEYAYGYGAIDALAASGIEIPPPPVALFKAYAPYPQPARFHELSDRVYFPIDVPVEGKTLTISIFSFGGDLVNRLKGPVAGSGELRDRGEAPSWDGTDFTGDDVAPGVYFYSIEIAGYGSHQGKLAVIR